MGKFTGVLLASDYDNTLLDTESARRSGGEAPRVSERNQAALRYFMEQGAVLRWPPAGPWRHWSALWTRFP